MQIDRTRKLERIELWFDDGQSLCIFMEDIQKMNEVGEHLQEINKAIDTAKLLASLRSEA